MSGEIYVSILCEDELTGPKTLLTFSYFKVIGAMIFSEGWASVWSLQIKFGFEILNKETNLYNEVKRFVLFNDFSYLDYRVVRTPKILVCCRIFVELKILPSINKDFVVFDQEMSWLEIIPAILIGSSLALRIKIESFNLYSIPSLAKNFFILWSYVKFKVTFELFVL